MRDLSLGKKKFFSRAKVPTTKPLDMKSNRLFGEGRGPNQVVITLLHPKNEKKLRPYRNQGSDHDHKKNIENIWCAC